MRTSNHLSMIKESFPQATFLLCQLRIIVYYVKVKTIGFKWLCAIFGHL